MIRLKIMLVLFSILVLFTSCGKTEKQEDLISKPITEKTTMDKIVIDVSYKLNIKLSNVQKLTKEDGIYYYIPIPEKTDIEFADMVLQGFIEKYEIDYMQDIRITKDKSVKEYWDNIHKQSFFIELYNENTKPGIPLSIDNISDINLLCIIVDDFGGFDGALLDDFCATDPAVTFAILPGLPFSKTVMHKAIRTGHEVIVHIPMEPENTGISPGKNAIMHDLSNQEIYNRVKSYFEELNYAVGANNHMGSKITQNKKLMQATLKYFVEKDFYFVDSYTIAGSVAYSTAKEMGIATARRHLFLDAPDNSDEILMKRLKDLQKLKDKQKNVLVITHCFDKGRLERLNKFIIEAEKMGFELVPASKFVLSEPTI